MSTSERFEIGSEVFCTDGACGELASVVVDPVAERLSHLIVASAGPVGSRLVPVEQAAIGEDGVHLSCTRDELARMEPAVQTHFIAPQDVESHYGYTSDQVRYWPFFALGPGPSAAVLAAPEPVLRPVIEQEDRVPAGEVRVRRGERVRATDGRIGRVRGLIVDAADDAVTHVLLDEGHLWGRKQVAVPISAVGDIAEDEVAVRLTKDEIKDLPPVEVVGLD